MQESEPTSKGVRRRRLLYISWLTLGLVMLLPVLVSAVIRLQTSDWPSWSGIAARALPDGSYVAGKTLWDLWQLLLVPAVLSVLAYLLARSERLAKDQSDRRQFEQQQQLAEQRFQQERHLAQEAQRDQSLQSYYIALADLLLEHDLRRTTTGVDLAASNLAHARTVAVTRMLDPVRKLDLFHFLINSELINGMQSAISLENADLTGINLSGHELRNINLRGANLKDSIVDDVIIVDTDLSHTDLSNCTFHHTRLQDVNLSGAILSGADLSKCEIGNIVITLARFDGATKWPSDKCFLKVINYEPE